MQELLYQVEKGREDLRNNITTNVQELILPIVKNLKARKDVSQKYCELLESSLKDIVESFGSKINQEYSHLSPKELEICNMIRSGFSTKDIARTLSISNQTVEKHRKNIRKKLGISSKSVNLASYLKNMSI